MTSEYAGSILFSLRRIIRSIDQHNKQLSTQYKLTVPQLVCLRQLLCAGAMTPGRLAKDVYLSQATVTGIIDRLEAKGLVQRTRSLTDRRRVDVQLTAEGERLANDMPWPLQERFATSLDSIDVEDQQIIDMVLKRLVEMMEAPATRVWPFGGVDSVNEEAVVTPAGDEGTSNGQGDDHAG